MKVYHGTQPMLKCSECALHDHSFYACCEGEELQSLQALKFYRDYDAGDVIVSEGGDLPFVGSVLSGSATLTQSLEDGRTQIVGLFFPSYFLGRPGRFTSSYAVTAATHLRLGCFDGKAFEELINKSPRLARRMLEMSLDELDAARERMMLLGRKTASEKVATLLSMLLRRAPQSTNPITAVLHLTREAMANYLGLTLETVSLQMGLLKRSGVITFKDRHSIQCKNLRELLILTADDTGHFSRLLSDQLKPLGT